MPKPYPQLYKITASAAAAAAGTAAAAAAAQPPSNATPIQS